MKNIRWDLISAAVDFYTKEGFEYYELPWHVSRETHSLISQKRAHETFDGCLVGSAEQSFVQIMLDGNFPSVHGIGVTPCFRDDTPGKLHKREFMKVELFIGGRRENFDIEGDGINFPQLWLDQVIRSAKFFFDSIDTQELKRVQTEDGWDMTSNGIEIGSYGVRRSPTHIWVYGTGLAEPRWSTAQKEETYY